METFSTNLRDYRHWLPRRGTQRSDRDPEVHLQICGKYVDDRGGDRTGSLACGIGDRPICLGGARQGTSEPHVQLKRHGSFNSNATPAEIWLHGPFWNSNYSLLPFETGLRF